jgi:hypothetical protein
MSRGLGKVERAVLAALAPTGTLPVTKIRSQLPATDKSAVSRALRLLHRKGLIVAESWLHDAITGRRDDRGSYAKRATITTDGLAKCQHLAREQMLTLTDGEP